jgi:Glycosyltransferase
MVGPDMHEKGGISTVIRNFSTGGLPIIIMSSWQTNARIREFIKIVSRLRIIIRDNNVEIVHFHVAQRGSFYRKAILSYLVPKGKKIIFHMHASQFDDFFENNSGRLKKWFIRKVLDHVDVLVAVSKQWKEYYQSITKTKVYYINNSVQTGQINLSSSTSKRIVTLGRIGKRKGSYDIVSIAKEVCVIDPEISFDLYGDGEIERFQELTAELSNVRVHTWIDKEHFYDELRGASFHFLPSYHEGLPMSILETMALGIPNIASDTGGISTVIENGKNGYLVTAGAITKMVNIILEACSNSNLIEKMSRESIQTIEENFGLDAYFEQWEELYNSLV